MSSDRPSASRLSAERSRDDPGRAALVRTRGAPLLEAVETHLPGSAEHAATTASYARAIAVALGVDQAVADLYGETAKLHDVGMVYVPKGIAHTPFERWDDAQRAQFEAHYEAGARLALGAGIPDDVCDWLLHIRERFDGGGPARLAGERIPLASRITRTACACGLVLAATPGGDPRRRRSEVLARLQPASGAELDPATVTALGAALERDLG